jgi:surface polysaccharide O-acyltransferase-like enzyme
MPKSNSQNQVLNLLKVVGAVAVVFNHLLYPLFSRADFFLGKGWWIATVIYSASVIAVPLFIIINGYLLLQKKESISKASKRVFLRLVIPLIFWFGFFLWWRIHYYPNHLTLPQIFGIILSGSMFHYYFLVILIGLQLLLPFWRFVINQGTQNLINLLGIGTLVISLGSYIISYSGLVPGAGVTLLTWWIPFTGYFWWGYWRKHHPTAPSAYWLLAFSSIFFLVIYLSQLGIEASIKDITLFRNDGIFYWHSLVSIPVFIMSIALFEAAMGSRWLQKVLDLKPLKTIISWLAPLTYGVYLTHFFVIEWVDMKYRYAIEFIQGDVQGFIIVRSLLVLALSFFISFILTHLPYIRIVVGIPTRVKRKFGG